MTEHRLLCCNSNNMSKIEDQSINLIVTSPPYPMIPMWDNTFIEQDKEIKKLLENGKGYQAFQRMHQVLNKTWQECTRVLKDGGFICIDIADSMRVINDEFTAFSNVTAIINYFTDNGYSILPGIHWKKISNKQVKFMGSGMYPAGAYVTQEHETILIFRKGQKRTFKGKEKETRHESAYFWEERNTWFSDIWKVVGTSQDLDKTSSSRNRSGSFPLEIAYRLINMYSIKGDWVLDPFSGLGTTSVASMIAERNSIGVDINKEITANASNRLLGSMRLGNSIINKRIRRHRRFMSTLSESDTDKCYKNMNHSFDVRTKQETKLRINKITGIQMKKSTIICDYDIVSKRR